MPLPTSGTLTMAQINAEFGRGNNLNAYRGTTYYTSGGGPFTFSSGAISFSDFYGTQATSPSFSATITSHYDQLNLRSWALANGWNGTSPANITLAGGYYIYSTVDGSAALTIDGSWPGGVTFVNNGYIMGMGGQGGGYYYIASGNVPINQGISNGSNAINLGVSCTIQNNSYIGGGGGGGGSIAIGVGTGVTGGLAGGGGAGGGAGGYYNNAGTITYGGAGGGIGSSGSAVGGSMGGGGGRIMPGSNTTVTGTAGTPAVTGTSTGGGASNAGSSSVTGSTPTSGASIAVPAAGGSGGGTGCLNVGYAYGAYGGASGGGGGYGASGGSASKTPGALSTGGIGGGAAGGKCVNLNGYSVTWAATGTRYGAIS